MNVAFKQFWLSGSWAPPAVLYHKVLYDKTVGWKEFKPPDWNTFVP
jgi:hypothetical protein